MFDASIFSGQSCELLCSRKAVAAHRDSPPCLCGLHHGHVVKWRKLIERETQEGQSTLNYNDFQISNWLKIKMMTQRMRFKFEQLSCQLPNRESQTLDPKTDKQFWTWAERAVQRVACSGNTLQWWILITIEEYFPHLHRAEQRECVMNVYIDDKGYALTMKQNAWRKERKFTL